MAEGPSADEIKRQIIAEKSEKWLQEKVKEHEEIYGSEIEDPALKLWMIAKANGIDVADLRAEQSDKEGTPLQLVDFTDKLAIEETEASKKKESGLYSVGPVLVTSEPDSSELTRKNNPKTFFYVKDKTGRAKVVAYTEDAIREVANKRVAMGKVIRLPLVSLLGGTMPDKNNPDGERVWKQITLPPFGRVEIVEGLDFTEFYKDPRKHPISDGDEIFVQGVVTHMDPKNNEVCTVCSRWVLEGKEEQHKKCGDYETRTETAYEGTITQGTGGMFRFTIPAYRTPDGPPDFPLGDGLTRLFGVWGNEYKTLKVQRWETITAKDTKIASKAPPVPQTKRSSSPATPTPQKPATNPAADPKPKTGVAKPEDVKQTLKENPEFTPDSPILSAVVRFITKNGGGADFADTAEAVAKATKTDVNEVYRLVEGWVNIGDRIAEEPLGTLRIIERVIPAKKGTDVPEEASDEPDSDATAEFNPSLMAAIPDGIPRPSTRAELEQMDFREMQALAKHLGLNARQKQPVLVQQIAEKLSKGNPPQAEDEEEEPQVEEEPEEVPPPARRTTKPPPEVKEARSSPSGGAAIPSTPPSTGEIHPDIRAHFEEYIRDFGGDNMTRVVVNNAISNPTIMAVLGVTEADVKKHGDKEGAARQKMHAVMEQAVQSGLLSWIGQWTDEGGERRPPKKVKWEE